LLAELARYFVHHSLTAVRLNIDVKKQKTQSIGFATFLRGEDALQFRGERHTFGRQEFIAGLSYNVPLLINRRDAAILVEGYTIWNSMTEEHNLLCVSIADIPGTTQPTQTDQEVDSTILDLEADATDMNID
jgi:hypothetical protein